LQPGFPSGKIVFALGQLLRLLLEPGKAGLEFRFPAFQISEPGEQPCFLVSDPRFRVLSVRIRLQVGMKPGDALSPSPQEGCPIDHSSDCQDAESKNNGEQ